MSKKKSREELKRVCAGLAVLMTIFTILSISVLPAFTLDAEPE